MDNLAYLFENLSSLVYAKTESDKSKLYKTLDELNKIEINQAIIGLNKEKVVLAINQLCYLIPDTEVELIKKALNLFKTLFTQLKLSLEGKTLSVATSWCLNCLKHKDLHLLTLSVLQDLIRGKGGEIEDQTDRIIQICTDLLKQTDPEELYHNAIKCIESLTVVGEQVEQKLTNQCLDLLLKILYQDPVIKNPILLCKCYVAAISGIINLVDNASEFLVDKLEDILGVVKGYMLYGLPGQDGFKIEKVIPTLISLPDQLKSSHPVKKAKSKYDKKLKKKTITPIAEVIKDDTSYSGSLERIVFTNSLTSDSDYSDSETAFGGKIRSFNTKVRLCALILLGTLIEKGDTKVLTRFILSFLPDGIQTSRTLITCLLKDSSPKCRSEVFIILSTILQKYKPFLSHADNLSRSSFTTFSTNIGNNLKELHSALTSALISENSHTVTTHALKTIADLIRGTPYHKLEPGLLSKMVSHVKSYLHFKDINIQISALTVFGCVVSVDPATEESREVILGNFLEEKSWEKPWLFRYCFNVLITEGSNNALATECWQVLGALARNFFLETVAAYPDDVIALLELYSRPGYSVKLYLAKFNETLVHAMQTKAACEDESQKAPVSVCTRLWNIMIPGAITQLIQSEAPGLRSTGCECLASVGIQTYDQECSLIFDELSRSSQIMCITHLFGCAKDDVPAVRSAAVRALAVFVLFSTLRQDPLFYLDTVDACFSASSDDDQTVRSQAAWLFGNIAEAALLNVEEGVDDEVEQQLICRLFDAGIKLSQDLVKIRPNAIRGLGSLLKITTASCFQKNRDKVSSAVDTIVKNAASGTFMKARWNSCYALKNALSNPSICCDIRSKVIPVLLDLVQNYKNFKVRISAGNAIGAITNRVSYGEYYIPIWSALSAAIDNSANIADFNEYQHRDQLVDQICATMCHLITIIDPSDLIPVHDILAHYVNQLQGNLPRFKDRVVPEKSSVIFDCDNRLGQLMEEELDGRQKKALALICAIFLTDRRF